MGTVTTDRVIPREWKIENHGNRGTFGLVSRDPTQPIFVDMHGAAGSESIEIAHVGDSTSFDILNIDAIIVRAASYPTRALVNFTTLDIELDAAPFVTVIPTDQVIVHRDALITGAVVGAALWTPAAGRRFVITDYLISQDFTGQVVLFDNVNAPGSIVSAPYMINGVPVAGGGYTSVAPNDVLRITTVAGGHTFVSVNGTETA